MRMSDGDIINVFLHLRWLAVVAWRCAQWNGELSGALAVHGAEAAAPAYEQWRDEVRTGWRRTIRPFRPRPGGRRARFSGVTRPACARMTRAAAAMPVRPGAGGAALSQARQSRRDLGGDQPREAALDGARPLDTVTPPRDAAPPSRGERRRPARRPGDPPARAARAGAPGPRRRRNRWCRGGRSGTSAGSCRAPVAGALHIRRQSLAEIRENESRLGG